MLVYFPAESPPWNPSGPSRNLRESFSRDSTSDAPVSILKRMDGFKIQVSNPGPRQRGQRLIPARRSPIGPSNESLHFGWHARRWRRLEVHSRLANAPGNHLHGFRSSSVASDISQVSAPAHRHAMPVKQHFLGKRVGKGSVQLDHHLGDASFRRPDAPFIRGKA